MNFSEINDIFDINEDLMKKIDKFKDERISKATSNADGKYCVIFHAIPLNAFSKLPISMNNMNNQLIKHSFFQGRYSYNFEGLYNDGVEFEFYQIFRNGIIEVRFEEYGSANTISVQYYKNECIKFVNDSLNVYNSIGIGGYILFYVTIVNVKDCILDEGPRVHSRVMDLERNILDPIGYIIDGGSNVENEVGKLFVPIFNHFGISDDYVYYQEE